LKHILVKYQAKDDKMINYHPTLGGLVDIPFTNSRKITETEGKLLDNLTFKKGLYGLNVFKGVADTAFSTSIRLYPDPALFPKQAGTSNRDHNVWAQNDGHRDAFRHAFWNALMTRNFGEKFAQQFSTAHEGVPGNTATREAMDLKNNEVGRKIAASNPEASPNELAALIKEVVSSGQLIVIDAKGKIMWSNQVAYGQHGKATGLAVKGNLAIPAGDAYPNK